MLFSSGITMTGGVQFIPAAGGGGGGGGSNPIFSNVKLLLPMNGANNSTTFTDYSATPKTISRSGTRISTAQYKWGGSSAYFEGGASNYLDATYSADIIQWNAQDYTIECWLYVNNMNSMSRSGFPSLVGQQNVYQLSNYWSFGPISDGTVKFYYYSGTGAQDVTSTAAITENTWNHIAMTRTSSGINVFVNGIGKPSATAVVGGSQYSGSMPLIIGMGWGQSIDAYVNDLRITHEAVYTSNFSVPTAAFPTS